MPISTMANNNAINAQALEQCDQWAIAHQAKFCNVMNILRKRIPAWADAIEEQADTALNQAADLPISHTVDRPIPSRSHPLEQFGTFANTRGLNLRAPGSQYAPPACDGDRPHASGPILNEASLCLKGDPLPAEAMAEAPPHGTSPTNFINAMNGMTQSRFNLFELENQTLCSALQGNAVPKRGLPGLLLIPCKLEMPFTTAVLALGDFMAPCNLKLPIMGSLCFIRKSMTLAKKI